MASVHPTPHKSKNEESTAGTRTFGFLRKLRPTGRGKSIKVVNQTDHNVFIILSEDQSVVTVKQLLKAKAGPSHVSATGKASKTKTYTYGGKSYFNIPSHSEREMDLRRIDYFMTIASHTERNTKDGKNQKGFVVHEANTLVGKGEYEITDSIVEDELEFLREL